MAVDMPLCYHGALSRKDCEVLMGKKNKDGSYLIRDSETFQGAMCLCVYKKHVVYTYRLLKTISEQYTLLPSAEGEQMYFKSLDELITHYKRKNQGLAMHLRHSVKRKTALLIRASAQIQNHSLNPRPDPRPDESRDRRGPSSGPELHQSLSGAGEQRGRPAGAQHSPPRPRAGPGPEQNQPLRGVEERRISQASPPGPEAGPVPRPVRGPVPRPVRGPVPRPVQGPVPRPVQGLVARPVQRPVSRPGREAFPPAEHEEVEYENLPEYVDVTPS